MFKYLSYFFVFVMILFIGCGYPSAEEGGGDGEEESGGNNSTGGVVLPDINTVMWKSKGGDIQFSTNNIAMTSSSGASYWHPRTYSGLTDDVIEASMYKVSGQTKYGYGLIFCIQNAPSKKGLIAKNFYCVLIRTDGFFQIIKVVNRVQHVLMITGSNSLGWKEALNNAVPPVNLLNKGKGVSNTIRVEITDPAPSDTVPDFKISFNGEEILTFEDNFLDDDGETLPQFTKIDGEYKYGFIVTLGPNEAFPYVPVDVRFNQGTPTY